MNCCAQLSDAGLQVADNQGIANKCIEKTNCSIRDLIIEYESTYFADRMKWVQFK